MTHIPKLLLSRMTPAAKVAADTDWLKEKIYVAAPPTDGEIRERIATYWNPYHQKLEGTRAEIKPKHGYALLWDAHSIVSVVPRFLQRCAERPLHGRLHHVPLRRSGQGHPCRAT